MTAASARWTQWVLRSRISWVMVLGALTLWLAPMAGTFRAANPYLALSVAVGFCLAMLAGILLVCRIAVATTSEVSGRVIHVFERYAPLVVINLIALNLVAPIVGFMATLLVNMPFWRTYLTLVGWLSAQVLGWLFSVAVAAVIAVAVMRLIDRVAGQWQPVRRAAVVIDRVIVGAAAIYCAGAMALFFNGSLDWSAAIEERGEITRVWGVPKTPVWWADVRHSDSSRLLARVLVFPLRDQVTASSLAQGQQVRVRIRPGLLKIPWVESMRLDFEQDLPSLVAAVPSAAGPRKWLIEALLRDGQWVEAARQTQAYARYYPNDRAFVGSVRATLQQARQPQVAADVGRLIIPVSGARTR